MQQPDDSVHPYQAQVYTVLKTLIHSANDGGRPPSMSSPGLEALFQRLLEHPKHYHSWSVALTRDKFKVFVTNASVRSVPK